MKETIELLGTILDETAKRDAVHIAVIPVIASQRVKPGEFVNAEGCPCAPSVGIVDPFIKGAVKPGERFFIFLLPKTITSLRHVWAHPSFPNEVDNDKAHEELRREYAGPVSEKWLRDFVKNADCPDYETVIAAACGEHRSASFQEYGDGELYLHFNGNDAHGSIPPEFWDHVEIVTGKKLTQRAKHFSCAC